MLTELDLHLWSRGKQRIRSSPCPIFVSLSHSPGKVKFQPLSFLAPALRLTPVLLPSGQYHPNTE